MRKLFPMSKSQISDFLNQTKANNCPNFLKSNCANLKHHFEEKYKNIYLDSSHEWKIKEKSKKGNIIDCDKQMSQFPLENNENNCNVMECDMNMGILNNTDYDLAQLSEFCIIINVNNVTLAPLIWLAPLKQMKSQIY